MSFKKLIAQLYFKPRFFISIHGSGKKEIDNNNNNNNNNNNRILELSIRNRQSNFTIVRKVLLSCRFGRTARFDCRSYRRHSQISVN